LASSNTQLNNYGLISGGTAYFVQNAQNDTTIILLVDSDRRASCRARAGDTFLAPNEKARDKKCFILSFSIFAILYSFFGVKEKSFFVNM